MKIVFAWIVSTLLLAGPALATPATTTYTYDDLGRVATVTYQNGMVITYNYDPAGNRTQVVTSP
jgi:YD repeat-containing protein